MQPERKVKYINTITQAQKDMILPIRSIWTFYLIEIKLRIEICLPKVGKLWRMEECGKQIFNVSFRSWVLKQSSDTI